LACGLTKLLPSSQKGLDWNHLLRSSGARKRERRVNRCGIPVKQREVRPLPFFQPFPDNDRIGKIVSEALRAWTEKDGEQSN
jgi:hypothetical protein